MQSNRLTALEDQQLSITCMEPQRLADNLKQPCTLEKATGLHYPTCSHPLQQNYGAMHVCTLTHIGRYHDGAMPVCILTLGAILVSTLTLGLCWLAHSPYAFQGF